MRFIYINARVVTSVEGCDLVGDAEVFAELGLDLEEYKVAVFFG